VLDDRVLAADHQAIATIESGNAAAGADVHMVETLCAQGCRAAQVIMVVGIAAVDDHVALVE